MHLKPNNSPPKLLFIKFHFWWFLISLGSGLLLLLGLLLYKFEQAYRDRVYPGITVADIEVSGATRDDIISYWLKRNSPLEGISITLTFENQIATLSGSGLEIGFDATLSATQALAIGRTGQKMTDWYHKILSFKNGIDLSPLFRFRTDVLDATLTMLAESIDIEPQNALFEFDNGRVTAFKPAQSGRFLDKNAVLNNLKVQLKQISKKSSPETQINILLPVLPQEPLVKTDQVNSLGITQLLGHGESFFRGSIPGRIHNIVLAASRVNGVLIAPGQTFSFNQALGDISAATGYKQAYVIKQGHTVLDDGGGVCQVSTTLFRAALNSGLPIVERHAHSYRVGYYELGGWKPGFDATVYAPSYDLKIKNDAPTHILIQAKSDTKNMQLTFELYGTKDDRIIEISPVRLWDAKPAPPDLYQDEPTLPNGNIKQIDWSYPGIKAAFDYKVTKDGKELFQKTFFSNFIPWQAVYLRGTGPAQ